MRIKNTLTNEIFLLKKVENNLAYFESDTSTFNVPIDNLSELLKDNLKIELNLKSVDIVTNKVVYENEQSGTIKNICIVHSALKELVYNKAITLLDSNFELLLQDDNWLFQNLEIPRIVRIFIPDDVYTDEIIANSVIGQLFNNLLPLVRDFIIKKTNGKLVYLEFIEEIHEELLGNTEGIIIEKKPLNN
jgi:hypothetical protein